MQRVLLLSPLSGEALRSHAVRTRGHVSGGPRRLPVPLPTGLEWQDLPAGSVAS